MAPDYHSKMTDATQSPPDPAAQEAAITQAVAARIAALRKGLGLSFEALARQSGVSKGTLVQIERQRANPSISTLCRLAAALHVSVADLVAPPGDAAGAVMRVPAAAARRLWTGPKGGAAVLLAGTPGPDMLEIWDWTLMPGERFESRAHTQGTRELLHVLEGVLGLEVEGTVTLIPAGDSAVVLTDRPHVYAHAGDGPLRFTMTVHDPPPPAG